MCSLEFVILGLVGRNFVHNLLLIAQIRGISGLIGVAFGKLVFLGLVGRLFCLSSGFALVEFFILSLVGSGFLSRSNFSTR